MEILALDNRAKIPNVYENQPDAKLDLVIAVYKYGYWQ